MRALPALPALVLAALLSLAGCGGGESGADALRRGDTAFASGDYTEAIAEYRLALRLGEVNVEALTRTAHAYARMGRVDEARDHYQQAIDLDPTVADLAASDLLRVAQRAADRRDGIAAAAAAEAALALQPGVSLTGLALPLARHFSSNGQYGQALPYFQKALREATQEPLVVFEMAMVHEELGDCRTALVFYEQVRSQLTVAQRNQVDWRIGNCSIELARDAQLAGAFDEALELYRTTIAIGEPRNRLPTVWFETAEILASRGACQEAIEAFQRVIREDSSGQLAERARIRIDEIRFRRSGSGPC